MGAQWSQFFPPSPTFTEANIESQEGQVVIVTGGYSGIGLELVHILYSKGARVYIAGRHRQHAQQAIEKIRADNSTAQGAIEFLQVDLSDLSTIKNAVSDFQARESKLNVLWNNAGVSQPPVGSISKQGFELQLATNCLGPFLFAKLLLPLLEKTAAQEPTRSSVRVVWTGSQTMELAAPMHGIVIEEIENPPNDRTRNYCNSKTGNFFLAKEFARRFGETGIISVANNPGAASTNLFRHTPLLPYLAWPLLYKAKLCAYTQLFAGVSEQIRIEHNGCYILPWGRIARNVRQDLEEAANPAEEGGPGIAGAFWDFCEEKTRDFA